MQADHLHGNIDFETLSPPMFHDDVVSIRCDDLESSRHTREVPFGSELNSMIIERMVARF
jgi:hypothetical protein